jgi:hypothetical protein
MGKHTAFGRGKSLRLLVLLASSVALLAASPPAAGAYVFGEPAVRQFGPEEMVYDYTTARCSTEDIPDHPARAFKDSSNRVQLIASHASVRRKIGSNLGNVQHQCPIVMDSNGNQDPSAFDDRQWLSSTYTEDGQTIYGLTSTEYHGWEYDEACASYVAAGQHLKCWYNSITLVKSVDGGAHYTHTSAPTHLVAGSPYRYAAGNGPLGYFDPSNIIKRSDGYYYAMIRAEPHGAQQRGACVMRTPNLNDPTAWRAWNGSGYTVSFMNPYTQTDAPENHVCTPVSPASFEIPIQTGSLTYSSYLGKYVLLGVSQKYDTAAGQWRYGFFYSLSDNLTDWAPMKLFMEAPLPWSYQCGGPDPVRDPTLIDPASSSRNFDTIGRHPYLYFSRYNLVYYNANTCWIDLDRDLLRIPVEFTESNRPPVASFTASPNPALTGQTVTFNGSASSDPDGNGTIASYKWDLDGNGSFETDTGMTPTVTRSYATAAVVTVRLRVTDTSGATNDTTRTLTVSNRPPTASFTFTPDQPLAGQVVTFDGSASSDPDGGIATYEWDLDGDSTFETTSIAPTVTMSYPSAATITVALRVTDTNGAGSAPVTRALTINPPPPSNELPTASFTASPNPAVTGSVVTFDASASTDPDGTIANYKWDLDGNGTFEKDTGTTPTASSSYLRPDAVTVRLRVTDNDGAAGDAIQPLTVSAPPPAPEPPAPTPGPPGPTGPPIKVRSPTAAACAAARTKRAVLTKRIQRARQKLAQAHKAQAKRNYRKLIKKLTRQRKRVHLTGCPR